MAKSGTGKRKPGRPRAKPGELRDQVVAVNFSAQEIASLVARAGSRQLRPYIRDAVLGRRLPKATAGTSSQVALDLAVRLTAMAGDLTTLAEAARSGRVLGCPPHILDRLHEAAHVAGLVILGARPDAR